MDNCHNTNKPDKVYSCFRSRHIFGTHRHHPDFLPEREIASITAVSQPVHTYHTYRIRILRYIIYHLLICPQSTHISFCQRFSVADRIHRKAYCTGVLIVEHHPNTFQTRNPDLPVSNLSLLPSRYGGNRAHSTMNPDSPGSQSVPVHP